MSGYWSLFASIGGQSSPAFFRVLPRVDRHMCECRVQNNDDDDDKDDNNNDNENENNDNNENNENETKRIVFHYNTS